jgi:hypothetical protein
VPDDELIHCRKASWLLSVGCERPLSAQESAALRRHLGLCPLCRAFEQQLHFLREASRRFAQ